MDSELIRDALSEAARLSMPPDKIRQALEEWLGLSEEEIGRIMEDEP